MPDAESFDAFYARTVWQVTSQMHERTGDDPLADHAIREAYAKAYQQWYQVSGYSDTQGWVLSAAQEAYDRRKAAAGPGDIPSPARRSAGNSSTWPGIYRPRRPRPAEPDSQPLPPADADATIGGTAAAGAGLADSADAAAAHAAGPGGSGAALFHLDAAGLAPGGVAVSAARPGRSLPVSRRAVIIGGLAAATVAIAAIGYAIAGGNSGHSAATSGQHGARTGPHMLLAGQTGARSAIPWSQVEQGWALAEYSTAAAGQSGQPSGGGTYVTYLVDPAGGKYRVTETSGGPEPALMAWSGDKKTALFAIASQAGGPPASYRLLNVQTGMLTDLSLPADVVAAGFTRPHGVAILAVREEAQRFRLQRYALDGTFQAAIATLPRKNGAVWPVAGCASACAISSPDGTADVWGIAGDVMAVVSNAGGKPQKLRPPGSAPSCVPLSWWDADTVLASCAPAADQGSARLWLLAATGRTATPVTPIAGTAQGAVEDAWQADGTTYVSTAQPGQCGSVAAAGLDIRPATAAAIGATVRIPDSQGNLGTVVTTDGHRLLVLAQTRCPGAASLVWVNPATGASQPVVRATGSQAGVIAAVPYGNGPSAVSAGHGVLAP